MIERPFDAPWQARAFALVVHLSESGLFSWDEWRSALAVALAADPDRTYYQAWLSALESVAMDRGGLSAREIDQTQRQWLIAAARTPHGQPIERAAPSLGRASFVGPGRS